VTALALRAIARVVALVTLGAVAVVLLLAGGAVLAGPDAVAALVRQAGLATALEDTRRLVATIAAGEHAGPALAAGAGALALWLLVLAGTLTPRSERTVALAGDPDVRVRRRTLRAAARTLARRVRDVDDARARLGRRALVLRVAHPQTVPRDALEPALRTSLAPLAAAAGRRMRVRSSRSAQRRVA
jgi:hypothetical protein